MGVVADFFLLKALEGVLHTDRN